jgi:hypothetical protein
MEPWGLKDSSDARRKGLKRTQVTLVAGFDASGLYDKNGPPRHFFRGLRAGRGFG